MQKTDLVVGPSEVNQMLVVSMGQLTLKSPCFLKQVEGFIQALPGMGSVFLLMGLIFYIGAVMATKMFGETHPDWFGSIGESLGRLS